MSDHPAVPPVTSPENLQSSNQLSSDQLAANQLAATHAAAFEATRSWSAAEFDALLSSRLCFATGDARCFALVRVVADEAELLTIATHPDYQRQGLARQVMRDWHRIAQARGAHQAFLEVAADNTAAQALYQSCDYDIVATRAQYYARENAPSVDAQVMRRTFSDQS